MNAHAVAVPIPAQRPGFRQFAALCLGPAWLITSRSFCGGDWCARPAPAQAAASIGRCATAPLCSIRPSVETMIEMTHRITSGITVIAMLALLSGHFAAPCASTSPA